MRSMESSFKALRSWSLVRVVRDHFGLVFKQGVVLATCHKDVVRFLGRAGSCLDWVLWTDTSSLYKGRSLQELVAKLTKEVRRATISFVCCICIVGWHCCIALWPRGHSRRSVPSSVIGARG